MQRIFCNHHQLKKTKQILPSLHIQIFCVSQEMLSWNSINQKVMSSRSLANHNLAISDLIEHFLKATTFDQTSSSDQYVISIVQVQCNV
mmetsp:Transcript_17473/g.37773  ORF Transcript_17473/g.37773 Transcript_17473/m.37773 type:complete len:89 (-) Transcript_17473:48-314(-)